MARININEADKYSNSGSDWLKLSDDGDTAQVQFMYDKLDDVDTFVVHKVKQDIEVNGRTISIDTNVSCLRENYNDPIDMCPLCASGLKQQVAIMLAMVDVNSKSIKIWERGKTFHSKISNLFNKYGARGNVSDSIFEIIRNGKPKDMKTTYDIVKLSKEDIEYEKLEAVDMSLFEKPNFLGTTIKEKTADEMQIYLDTGSFPNDNDNNEQPTRRRRGSEEETREEAPRRRRG